MILCIISLSLLENIHYYYYYCKNCVKYRVKVLVNHLSTPCRLALDLSPLRLSNIYRREQSFNENIQKYCWILPARTNDLIFNIFWNSNWISQLPPSLFFQVLTVIRTSLAPGELVTQVRLDSRWLITKCCLSRIVMFSRDSKGISELPLIQLI